MHMGLLCFLLHLCELLSRVPHSCLTDRGPDVCRITLRYVDRIVQTQTVAKQSNTRDSLKLESASIKVDLIHIIGYLQLLITF